MNLPCKLKELAIKIIETRAFNASKTLLFKRLTMVIKPKTMLIYWKYK